MTAFLRSGRGRDICVLIASADEPGKEELQSRLEAHYGEQIESQSFDESLAALVDAGYAERRTGDAHDAYALTATGERALLEHLRWVTARLEAA